MSDLKRKNIESIAYRYDQDRRGLQHFIGAAPWDFMPLERELVGQVGHSLGQSDGVIVFDPSGHKKCGKDSVGIQRQWLGRLGKVENCQAGLSMGYVARIDHALVASRFYLPKEWAKDHKRRKRCGVPKEIRFQTRHELALAVLQAYGDLLPHRWIAGDDEMGRSSAFRRHLRGLEELYLLAVPLIHTLLTLLLRQACDCEHPDWDIRSAQRKSRRKELARFYHYKKRNLLAPLRLKQKR